MAMPTRRKTKQQLEQERAERERKLSEIDRKYAERLARLAEEAHHQKWLEKQPRTEMPAQYDETIHVHVHKRVLDAFMKKVGKKIDIESSRVVGGMGGKYVLEYRVRGGGSGRLELNDLGPMPT
jgi:hypothetical protein